MVFVKFPVLVLSGFLAIGNAFADQKLAFDPCDEKHDWENGEVGHGPLHMYSFGVQLFAQMMFCGIKTPDATKYFNSIGSNQGRCEAGTFVYDYYSQASKSVDKDAEKLLKTKPNFVGGYVGSVVAMERTKTVDQFCRELRLEMPRIESCFNEPDTCS